MYTEILTSRGFKIYKECGCGGTKNQYFKNLEYRTVDIKVLPNKGIFQITHNNRIIKNNLAFLEQELEKLICLIS